MKKNVRITLVLTLFCGVLLASPIEKLDNWAKQQTDNFEANDVVNFLNRNRAEGDITYGSEYVFNSATTQYGSAITLDATHFIVAYCDNGNSGYGTAIVGTVSGLGITYGSEFVFNYAMTYYCSATTLDATHFVVAYRDAGNSDCGTAIVGTVSGSSISYGSEFVFNSGEISMYCTPTALDATHFVVAYCDYDNSSYGTAIVGSVSGSSISYGSEFVFNSASTYDFSPTTMDTTHFVVVYIDEGNSGYGTAIVGTVSGSNISYGAEYVFNSATTQYCSATTLDATRFVVAYRDYGNSFYGTAIVGTVSGSSISYGSEFVFNSADTSKNSTTTLDATHFVVAYRDVNIGRSIVGTVEGSSLSYGSEFLFNHSSGDISPTTLDATHFVVAYRDAGNSSYGTVRVGEVEIPLSAPANVIITIVDNNIELTWDDMGAVSYNIYRSTDPYAGDWGDAFDSSAVNSYTDVGAASGTKYFYYVTASD